jgi:hypothetical protein
MDFDFFYKNCEELLSLPGLKPHKCRLNLQTRSIGKLPADYVQLRMYLEADAELDEIDPFCRAAPEVLAVRLEIYAGLKKWELMQAVAKKLAEHALPLVCVKPNTWR